MEQELWNTILGELEVSMSRGNFITWIKPTRLATITDGVATVSVPNTFYKERFETHFKRDLLAALRRHIPTILDIVFDIGSAATPAHARSATTEIPNATRTTHPSLEEGGEGETLTQSRQSTEQSPTIIGRLTFSTFVEGSNNRMAYTAAQTVARETGNRYNPLFIYGGVGLGKTHLMHAIANDLLAQTPNLKALYVSCETFTNNYIDAIRSRKMDSFKRTYRSVDVLLVDDIQFIANKEGSQEEFFNTFNTLHQGNRQIVLAADRPPSAIIGLEERLSSRFGWGLVVDIQPPNLETRIAILERKALEKGVSLPPDVAQWIASQAQSNIRELEGALNSVMGRCEVLQIPVSIEAAKAALSGMFSGVRHRGLTAESIVSAIAEHYGVSVSDLCGKKRNQHLVHPRHVAMYVLRDQLGLSYPDIGKALGGRDHTTVIHGVAKITAARSQHNISHDLDAIRTKLH